MIKRKLFKVRSKKEKKIMITQHFRLKKKTKQKTKTKQNKNKKQRKNFG